MGQVLENEIKRGDIFYANLSSYIGSEQGGIKPVVIIQNNKGNYYSPTVIVAVITSKFKKVLPTHQVVYYPLKKNSVIMFEQIRTIDKCRLTHYIGCLPTYDIQRMSNKIKISLGLDHDSE